MIDTAELRRLAEQASKNSFVSYGNKREQEYAERCRERLNSAAHPCAVLELIDEIERLQESAADKTKDIAYYHEQLVAANARVAELEYKLMAQTETALQEKAKREQAEAQNKRMQTAINRYVIGNIELLDAMKDALEEK